MESHQNVVESEEPKREAPVRPTRQPEARTVEEELELFPFGANPGITFGRD